MNVNKDSVGGWTGAFRKMHRYKDRNFKVSTSKIGQMNQSLDNMLLVVRFNLKFSVI